MNDRYLFKALRIGWKNLPKEEQWAQGYFIKKHGIPFIYETSECPMNSLEVYESTVCQCTGLEDKNGTLIWENDICIYDDSAKFVVKFGEYNEFTDKNHIGFYAKWEDRWDGLYREDLGYWNDEVEVIGSIFDNPELLEVE